MKLSCGFPPGYIKGRLFRLVMHVDLVTRDKDESCHSFMMLGHFNRSPFCRLVSHFFFYLTLRPPTHHQCSFRIIIESKMANVRIYTVSNKPLAEYDSAVEYM